MLKNSYLADVQTSVRYQYHVREPTPHSLLKLFGFFFQAVASTLPECYERFGA